MRATALLHRLPHPADTAHRRRGRKRAAAAHVEAPAHVAAPPAPRQETASKPMRQDTAVARVREAGGPIDNASYTCACGFVFAASVSTTVACPHCGAAQAW
jgi:hypothetical protein